MSAQCAQMAVPLYSRCVAIIWEVGVVTAYCSEHACGYRGWLSYVRRKFETLILLQCGIYNSVQLSCFLAQVATYGRLLRYFA